MKENPNDIEALRVLATIYNNLGQMKECYKIAERLLFICPDNEAGLYYMCRKSYEKKDWNSLEKWGKKGYSLEDKDNREKSFIAGCLYFYAKALYEKGDKFDAMRIYAEAEKEDPFDWLHAEFEVLGGIPCTILSLSVGNEKTDGTIIDKPGEPIHAKNSCLLVPKIKVRPNGIGSYNLDVKFYQNGQLWTNSKSSPFGYSYSEEIQIHGMEEQEIVVGGCGGQYVGRWSKGDYRFEIWWKGNKLYSQSFKIY